MSERGETYWDWADPDEHCRIHEERLKNGLLIDIHVRLSQKGDTQLFIGVYSEQGTRLFEEAYLSRPGETMTQAMEWGIQHAKEVVKTLNVSAEPSKAEALPRQGSRQAD
ncbi:hypothetical protein OH720_18665 [Pseudomonas sp. WJP1]|uniref:hypothetical protein n=1 Tax=Pseudomonas sp. WJP1 TaxID=2986947 RepID=UPI00234AC5AD|nr:hypothetical protein [Pseudomonas sp. WJP1]WCM49030.1 hypothetical protein OH720_18665 [Pseudomonas sp. WJP1]